MTTLNRRDLLTGIAAGAMLATIMPHPGLARPSAPDWRLGFRTAPASGFDTAALDIEGRWPAALKGTFFRNGPARFELGGQRYEHWFDGDGMVQAFHMADGRISHRGRFVETPKFRHETAQGRFTRMALGTRIENADPLTGPDSINTANTSILPLGGALYALWEGGSAFEMDPRTLSTIGPKKWRDDLTGVAFSAHPRVEADGTVWNFGAFGNRMVLYRIGADGALHGAKTVGVPFAGMVHDFTITARHIVVMLSPFVAGRQADTIFGMFDWQPGHGLAVLVIDKDTLEVVREYRLPAGFIFHFANAWEEGDGTIHLDYCLYDDASFITQGARSLLSGMAETAADVAGLPYHVRATLPPAGEARLDLLGRRNENVEFPRIDDRLTGRRHRHVLLADHSRPVAGNPLHARILLRDIENGAESTFDYGPHVAAEEHIFIPHPSGREGETLILGTSLDLEAGITRLAVFEPARLAEGPLALAHLPYPLPLGFHGQFSPA